MIEQSWLYLAAGASLLVLLIIFVKKISGKNPLDQSLSHKERMFTSILEKAVGGQYIIYCKVPMEDVFETTSEKPIRAERKALKLVQGRQFDYIVCDPSSRKVVCAVELDDHHYENKRHVKRDLMIEDICEDAALPLLRVAPQNGYNLVEIIERFERTIAAYSEDNSAVEFNKFNLKVADRYSPDTV